jgi:hypothetical protein
MWKVIITLFMGAHIHSLKKTVWTMGELDWELFWLRDVPESLGFTAPRPFRMEAEISSIIGDECHTIKIKGYLSSRKRWHINESWHSCRDFNWEELE